MSDCNFKTKQKSNSKRKLSFNYNTNQFRGLKRHKSDVHDIGVTWHHCDVSECEYKTKQKRTLKQHKADVHD